MNNLHTIKENLKSKGLKVTKPRELILETFCKSQKDYFTPEEISSELEDSCDQATVYRNLNKLTTLGLLKKSAFHNQACRFSLNLHETKKPHQHYFLCRSCEKLEPIQGCFLESQEKELKAKGYDHLEHHLEITGICPDCL